MADTRRTFAALAVLFADNTAGAISAQDLRDFLASMKMHTSSSAPTTSDDDTSGFDVGHEWLETSTPAIYKCRSATTGAAVWEKTWPASVSGVEATEVSYDNSTSGLTADEVQAAIDEIVAGLGTAAAEDVDAFASAAQGAKADAALPKLATVNSYAGNRTLDSSDSGAYVRITAAGTVNLPDGLSTGFQCVIVNATDSDAVALSAATTLTIPSGFDASVQNRRAVTVIHVGSNVWEAHGALAETV